MKIPCSSCNQRLEVPEELAGQTIECPACKVKLTVPSLATPTAAPTPGSASQKTLATAPLKKAKGKKGKSRLPIIAAAGLVCILIMGVVTFSLSGSYQTYKLEMRGDTFYMEVDSGGSFILAPPDGAPPVFGKWKTGGNNGELIICTGKARGTNEKITVSYDMNTLELVEFRIEGKNLPIRLLGSPSLKKTNYTIDTR